MKYFSLALLLTVILASFKTAPFVCFSQQLTLPWKQQSSQDLSRDLNPTNCFLHSFLLANLVHVMTFLQLTFTKAPRHRKTTSKNFKFQHHIHKETAEPFKTSWRRSHYTWFSCEMQRDRLLSKWTKKSSPYMWVICKNVSRPCKSTLSEKYEGTSFSNPNSFVCFLHTMCGESRLKKLQNSQQLFYLVNKN